MDHYCYIQQYISESGDCPGPAVTRTYSSGCDCCQGFHLYISLHQIITTIQWGFITTTCPPHTGPLLELLPAAAAGLHLHSATPSHQPASSQPSPANPLLLLLQLNLSTENTCSRHSVGCVTAGGGGGGGQACFSLSSRSASCLMPRQQQKMVSDIQAPPPGCS